MLFISVSKTKKATFLNLSSSEAFCATSFRNDNSAEERAIGGLGIFIVNQIMDNVSYRRENGQNILMLTKRL